MKVWYPARIELVTPRSAVRHINDCAVRASPVSLRLALSKKINPSLVLVQSRKPRPFITERLLMGRKESNQTNKQNRLRYIAKYMYMNYVYVMQNSPRLPLSSWIIRIYHIYYMSQCDFQQCGTCDQQSLRSACA